MSIYPSTKASNVPGGGAGVSSPGSRAGPYGGQRSGKKRGSAFAPFGSSLGFGVMFGGEGHHYGGGDAAGAGAHGFGEVDKQWGPQNTSWERMPPMRIFEAKDSKNACITDCHVSLDGRYLVFTQRMGGCSVYELSSGKNSHLSNAKPDETLDACALWTDARTNSLRLMLGGAATGEGRLCIWDQGPGQPAPRCTAEFKLPQSVCGCAWSSDGELALATGREFACVYYVDTEETAYRLPRARAEHTTWLCGVFHPEDSRWVALGGTHCYLEILNWEHDQRSTRMAETGGLFTASVMHHHAARMASSFGLRGEGLPKRRSLFHGAPVTCVAYAPNPDLIASGGGTKVIVWDVSRASPTRLHQFEHDAFRLHAHVPFPSPSERVVKVELDGVASLDFSLDGQMLAVAGGESLIVWHVHTGGRVREWDLSDKICCTSFSPDGTMVCAGGNDWKLTIRDLSTEVEVRVIQQEGVIDVSRDGHAYAHNHYDGFCEVRGLLTNEVMCTTHKKCEWGVLSPQMTYFAMKCSDRSVAIYLLKDEHGHPLPRGELFREHMWASNAWAKARQAEASGANAHALAVIPLDLAGGSNAEREARLDIDCAEFSPNDEWLVLGVSCAAVLVDMSTGNESVHPQGHHLQSIAFSHIGKQQVPKARAVGESGLRQSPPLGAVDGLSSSSAGLQVAFGLQYKGLVWIHDLRLERQLFSEVAASAAADGAAAAPPVPLAASAGGQQDAGDSRSAADQKPIRCAVPRDEDIENVERVADIGRLKWGGDSAQMAEASDPPMDVQKVRGLNSAQLDNVREAHAKAYACLDHGKCSIQDCVFSPDGIHFATANGDLNIWSLDLARHDDSKKRSGALVHKRSGMSCVRFAAGGRYVVAGKDDNLLLIEVPRSSHGAWVPVRRFRLPHPLSKGDQPGKSIIFSQTTNHLMLCTTGGVRVWDFERVITLAPPVEQLFWCDHDIEYTRRMIQMFPYLLYQSSSQPGHKGMTFVQYCCHTEGKSEHLRQALAITPDAVLVENDAGSSFTIALNRRNREVIKVILKAVLNSSQPSARTPFVDSLPQLILDYPDLLSKFFIDLGLATAESDCKYAYVGENETAIYKGCFTQSARGLWNSHNADFKSSVRGRKPEAVISHYVGLPGVSSVKVLDAISMQNPKHGMFDNEIIKAVVGCLWNNHVKNTFMFRFYSFGLTFALFFVWSFLIVQQLEFDDPSYNFWRGLKNGDLFRDQFSSVPKGEQNMTILSATFLLDIILWIQVALHIPRESMQFWKTGPSAYFSEKGNLNDILCVAMMGYLPYLHVAASLEGDDVAKQQSNFRQMLVVGALLSMTIILKLLTYMQALESFGFMVNMFQQIMVDIYYFVILLLLFQIAFSNAFFLLFAQALTTGSDDAGDDSVDSVDDATSATDDAGDDDRDDTFPDYDYGYQFLSTFLMMLGEFDLAEFWTLRNRWLVILLFILWLFGSIIVLLNVLIAVLSDSYQNVRGISDAANLKMRLEIIVEFLEESSERKLGVIMEETRWVHALVPVSAKERAAQEADDHDGFDDEDKAELIHEADKDKEELLVTINQMFRAVDDRMNNGHLEQVSKLDEMLGRMKKDHSREMQKTIGNFFFGNPNSRDDPDGAPENDSSGNKMMKGALDGKRVPEIAETEGSVAGAAGVTAGESAADDASPRTEEVRGNGEVDPDSIMGMLRRSQSNWDAVGGAPQSPILAQAPDLAKFEGNLMQRLDGHDARHDARHQATQEDVRGLHERFNAFEDRMEVLGSQLISITEVIGRVAENVNALDSRLPAQICNAVDSRLLSDEFLERFVEASHSARKKFKRAATAVQAAVHTAQADMERSGDRSVDLGSQPSRQASGAEPIAPPQGEARTSSRQPVADAQIRSVGGDRPLEPSDLVDPCVAASDRYSSTPEQLANQRQIRDYGQRQPSQHRLSSHADPAPMHAEVDGGAQFERQPSQRRLSSHADPAPMHAEEDGGARFDALVGEAGRLCDESASAPRQERGALISRALALYETVLQSSSSHPVANVGRGFCLLRLGRNDEALVALDAAIASDPDGRGGLELRRAWSLKSEALQLLGRVDEAHAAFERALSY